MIWFMKISVDFLGRTIYWRCYCCILSPVHFESRRCKSSRVLQELIQHINWAKDIVGLCLPIASKSNGGVQQYWNLFIVKFLPRMSFVVLLSCSGSTHFKCALMLLLSPLFLCISGLLLLFCVLMSYGRNDQHVRFVLLPVYQSYDFI